MRKSRRPRRRLWRWAFLIVVAMGTITSAMAVGLFIGVIRELPPIEELEHYDPPQVSKVFDRSGGVPIGEFRNKDERRQVIPIDEIPQHLQDAFIAVEDERFYSHFGVDIIGIARAFLTNLKQRRITEGASTITMQLTRNILEKVGRDKTLERKIKEAILAVQIERRYSKSQILEFYLNHISFSGTAFGVSAASNAYFSKPVGALTLAESATIAAIPNAVTAYNPLLHPENALRRRNIILSRMQRQAMITEEERDAAQAEPLVCRPGTQQTWRHPYFVDALRKHLMQTAGVPESLLENGGLRITATVDPSIQEACEAALHDGLVKAEEQWQEAKPGRQVEERNDWNGVLRPGDVMLMRITKVSGEEVEVQLNQYRGTVKLPEVPPFYNPEAALKTGKWLDVRVTTVEGNGRIEGTIAHRSPVQGAAVVLDVRTGEVLGLAGGYDWFNGHWAGQWNRAIQGGRQPGSCFKPFFYGAALERNIPPNSIIVDEPVEYENIPKPYRPINYEKDFSGPMTLINALAHSRNVVTIRLFEAIGPTKALDIVRRFDFTHPLPQWSLPRELAIPLGTTDVSPLELAAGYQAIANMGIGIKPQFVRDIQDSRGRVPFRVQREEHAILEPVPAYQLQYMLRRVVLEGTGQRPVGDKFASPPNPPVYGKTGTTNDCRDAWFCGFTPDLVIVVQVGFDQPHPMGRHMTGGNVAGPIWADAFKRILGTRGNWRMTFEAPAGIRLANICMSTGKLASDFCTEHGHHAYLNVPYKTDEVPAERCDGGMRALIKPVGERYRYLAARTSGFAHAAPGEISGPEADWTPTEGSDAVAATASDASQPGSLFESGINYGARDDHNYYGSGRN